MSQQRLHGDEILGEHPYSINFHFPAHLKGEYHMAALKIAQESKVKLGLRLAEQAASMPFTEADGRNMIKVYIQCPNTYKPVVKVRIELARKLHALAYKIGCSMSAIMHHMLLEYLDGGKQTTLTPNFTRPKPKVDPYLADKPSRKVERNPELAELRRRVFQLEKALEYMLPMMIALHGPSTKQTAVLDDMIQSTQKLLKERMMKA